LMEAQILIGIKFSLPVEHPDFQAVVKHDSPVAFGEIRYLFDEYLGSGFWLILHV
jgi:hypothetical protein